MLKKKPEEAIFQQHRPKSATQSQTPLHPAIANAKAFVNNQDIVSRNGSGYVGEPQNLDSGDNSNMVEKPVFAGSASPALAMPIEPLVSPDSIERRETSERRDHPLRRGADREEEDFKKALMSPQTDIAVNTAFEQLKNNVADNLDGKVEGLLRPMLREWLDENLPSMVERLVRNEIERVSRGE